MRELHHSQTDRWKLEIVELIHRDGYGMLPSTVELAADIGASETRTRHVIHRDSRSRRRGELLPGIRETNANEAEARGELDDLLRCFAQV